MRQFNTIGDLCAELRGRKGHEVASVTFSADKCPIKVRALIISTLDANTSVHYVFIGTSQLTQFRSLIYAHLCELTK